MNAIFYEHKNTTEVFQCYYCHWSQIHDNCQFFKHTKNNEATQFGDQNLFYIVAFTLNPAEQITHLTHTHTHTPHQIKNTKNGIREAPFCNVGIASKGGVNVARMVWNTFFPRSNG